MKRIDFTITTSGDKIGFEEFIPNAHRRAVTLDLSKCSKNQRLQWARVFVGLGSTILNQNL